MSQEEEFLTKAQVARLVGLSPASIRLAAEAGKLAVAARTVAGARLFRLADVEAYLRSRERSGESKKGRFRSERGPVGAK